MDPRRLQGVLAPIEEFAGAQLGVGCGQLSPDALARWPVNHLDALLDHCREWISDNGDFSIWMEALDETRTAGTPAYAITNQHADMTRARVLSLYSDLVIARDLYPLSFKYTDRDWETTMRIGWRQVCATYIQLRPLMAAGMWAFLPYSSRLPHAPTEKMVIELGDAPHLGAHLGVRPDDFGETDDPAWHRDLLRGDLWRGAGVASAIGGQIFDVSARSRAAREVHSAIPGLQVKRLDALARVPLPSFSAVDSNHLVALASDSSALAEVRQALGVLYDSLPSGVTTSEAAQALDELAAEQLAPAAARLRREARAIPGVPEQMTALMGCVVAGVELATTGQVGPATAATAALMPVPYLAGALRRRSARRSARAYSALFGFDNVP